MSACATYLNMKHSKYDVLLKPFLKKAIFNAAETRAKGIPSRMLAYYCQKGLIERMSRGLYRVTDFNSGIDFNFEDLVLTVLSIPNGVICLISALCYYNLTDQIMREYWIAVPNEQKSPIRPHTRIIRMRNMSLGLTSVRIGKYEVQIFDRERTIVDAFRFLSSEIAIKALQNYLKDFPVKKPDLQKLSKYAKALRVNIDSYILAFTT